MDIKMIHDVLNNIYKRAESYNDELSKLGYKTYLQSYNNHYIRIDGKLCKQDYYMPVISIIDCGDICFNLDSIEFEFYVTKRQMDSIDLDGLINNYKNELSIYEFINCTVDMYKSGDSKDDVLAKIAKSLDTKFGISIDCSTLSKDDIIRHFNLVCSLLNIGKKNTAN